LKLPSGNGGVLGAYLLRNKIDVEVDKVADCLEYTAARALTTFSPENEGQQDQKKVLLKGKPKSGYVVEKK
jgi:hypothetical protein